MARTGFDKSLQNLHNDLLRMGSMVEKQLYLSIDALLKHDSDLADKVISGDDDVDMLQKDMENSCIKLIAKQQPLATDLRAIFTTIKLVTDLERMADYAVNIAKIAKRLKNEKYIKELIDIPKMGEIAREMIRKSLDAYVERDVDLAYEVCKMDDKIDAAYKNVFNEMLPMMAKDSSIINQATQFLFICKYLERVADHVTNICEGTIYLVTGECANLND